MSDTYASGESNSIKVVSAQFIYPFILVTSLFALWGFANDITNPLVKAFREIFQISNTQSSLVQTAFYGGYATMAIPAAIFIRKYSYKSGIILGLALYAVGALLTIPASLLMQFNIFLLGFYILTFGLAFLETTANPYILSMGSPETATRRLNLAQAFNPIGSLSGMLVAKYFIQARLTGDKGTDLEIVRIPYTVIGVVVIAVLLVFVFSRLPKKGDSVGDVSFGATLNRLLANRNYVEGVIAQAFYVGAQIMCWTYIFHYAEESLGMVPEVASNYNITAMVIFCTSRFICTFLLKYATPGKLLMTLAALAGILTLGTIFLQGMIGLYSLVGISACMSLMFPTIYGIALNGLGDDAKLASAGLIFAIVGGAVMPFLQGWLIDFETILGMSAIRFSFFLPLICFVVIAHYGKVSASRHA
ncbi:MAG: L-fucose:H+ symporter permease [Verrucomicrobia bacterium]|nr:L-fucose:H+ symporter permease [Verrucomicrobiota bacterium]